MMVSIGDLVFDKRLFPPSPRWGVGQIIDLTNKFAIVTTNLGTFRVAKSNLKHYKEPKYEPSPLAIHLNPELYQSFHGNQPTVRRVKVRIPDKGDRLISIGRLVALEYQPYGSSKRKKILYRHSMGDYGHKIGKHKPILSVSSDGRQLFILNEGSDYTFGERGIVG